MGFVLGFGAGCAATVIVLAAVALLWSWTGPWPPYKG